MATESFFLTNAVLLYPGRAAAAAQGKCQAPPLLDQVCEAGKTILGKAGDLLAAPVRAAAGGAVGTITSWVSDGAQWLLSRVVSFLDHSTSPDLGAAWFTDRYHFMVGLAALVLVPILLIATLRAIVNQDPGQLLRSFFVHLPAAILTTFIAIFLTSSLLDITDAMSAAVAHGIAGDVSQLFDGVTKALGGAAGTGASSFVIFFGALFIIIGSFFVWLELLVRSAAVTVSVFFLPLVLVGLVWPVTARWTRRLVETLVALILSKFVIVAVISLATAALSDPGAGGFGAVMGGAALMGMAAFSPFALLGLIPIAEGAAIGHLEGLGRKPLDRVSGSVNHAVSIMHAKTDRGRQQESSSSASTDNSSSATSGSTPLGSSPGGGVAQQQLGRNQSTRGKTPPTASSGGKKSAGTPHGESPADRGD